jgi:hypothetical protein
MFFIENYLQKIESKNILLGQEGRTKDDIVVKTENATYQNSKNTEEIGISKVETNRNKEETIEHEEYEGEDVEEDENEEEVRQEGSNNNSKKKKKLRTSEEVYNRILWDPQYDREDFIIGYMDRYSLFHIFHFSC